MNLKQNIQKIVPASLWRYLRERKIVAKHSAVVRICEELIKTADSDGLFDEIIPLKDIGTDKVIWQYWAQGYDNLPPVIEKCQASVDKYKGDYIVIRLSDETIDNYLVIPDYIVNNRNNMTVAHFSDILRSMLLSAYGGIWIDASVLLTAPIPKQYLQSDLFLFQRDSKERNKDYWENTYAYYFGWKDGFRVRMLSSFIVAKKHSPIIDELCRLMLNWWKKNSYLPDYFFFQILFDVLINGKYKNASYSSASDCLPHYLQQAINDPAFNLMPVDEIKNSIPIHKLTYKKES